MKTYLPHSLLLLCLAIAGCKQSAYYREDVKGGAEKGGYSYWCERKPTTEHGICAAVYGSREAWEVDLPHGVNTKTPGSLSVETTIVTSYKEAELLANTRCPLETSK